MSRTKNSSKIYKPVLRYQGNKYKLIPFLKEHISVKNNQIWLEPFLGSGAVFFNFAQENAIGSDINSDLVNLLLDYLTDTEKTQLLLDYLEREAYLLETFGAEYYYAARETFNETKNPAVFLFLNTTCFNGICRYNSKGEFNSSFNRNPSKLKNALPNWKTKIVEVSEILNTHKSWKFCSMDFREFMKENCSENSICYLDPPYFNKNTGYACSWKLQDTIDLLNLINELPGEFWLSSCIDEKNSGNVLDFVPFKYELFTTEHMYIVGGVGSKRYTTKEILLKKV